MVHVYMCVCIYIVYMSVCLSVYLTEFHVPEAAFPLNLVYNWECLRVLNPLPPKCWGYSVAPCLADAVLGLDQLEKCFTNWAISQALFLEKYIFEIWCLFLLTTRFLSADIPSAWLRHEWDCMEAGRSMTMLSPEEMCVCFSYVLSAECAFWVHPRTRGLHLGILPSYW